MVQKKKELSFSSKFFCCFIRVVWLLFFFCSVLFCFFLQKVFVPASFFFGQRGLFLFFANGFDCFESGFVVFFVLFCFFREKVFVLFFCIWF